MQRSGQERKSVARRIVFLPHVHRSASGAIRPDPTPHRDDIQGLVPPSCEMASTVGEDVRCESLQLSRVMVPHRPIRSPDNAFLSLITKDGFREKSYPW
jgi:hypothetical protein